MNIQEELERIKRKIYYQMEVNGDTDFLNELSVDVDNCIELCKK